MTIGVRREDKHEWERRVPLTPEGVRHLVSVKGLEVVVQPSPIRAFTDEAYVEAGAEVRESLDDCQVVLAVKEIPAHCFRQGAVYVFFSHTIKGQAHNMPMLRRLSELGCTLLDYERIVDADGRRLVFFGRHAGLAGMIDTFSVLGRRLASLGHRTPFADLGLSHEHADLAAAEAAVDAMGRRIASEGLPKAVAPFVVGFSGYGNVSQGAQAIFDRLPSERVTPAELAAVTGRADPPTDRVFGVVFEEEHLVERADGSPFDKQDYFAHPERYRSTFEQHVKHLSVLVNAIYWTEEYPRLLTRAFLKRWYAEEEPRLLVVGDISCDIEGSIESTLLATTPGAPAYVYEPATGEATPGTEGPGLAMMTTDCLPCELPRESSASFNEALLRFVPALARLDTRVPFERAALPEELRRACILWQGGLTEDYRYLAGPAGL